MKNLNDLLPTDIITDILTRLPAKSVLQCKSVCKTWKDLIQHPSFPQIHLSRLHSIDSGKLRYVFLDDKKQFFYFESYDDEDWYVKPSSRMIQIVTPFKDYVVIGSVNGLICIYGYHQPRNYDKPYVHGPACIFNPVTREYILLPDFDSCPEYNTKGEEDSIEFNHLACGFGYVDETNEYKVVRIYRVLEEYDAVEVEVYTVGSGKGWRNVGKFNIGLQFFPHWMHTHGVFLNGALHWRNTEGEGMVVVFDLAKEKFRDHIPPPPMLADDGFDDFDDYFFDDSPMIGASGGGILYYAACQSRGRNISEVWLLMGKDEDEQEKHQSLGWSKVNSLDQKEPFAFTDYGIVLRYDQGTVNMFNSGMSRWGALLANSAICRQIFSHKHSLISLKDLGEEVVHKGF